LARWRRAEFCCDVITKDVGEGRNGGVECRRKVMASGWLAITCLACLNRETAFSAVRASEVENRLILRLCGDMAVADEGAFLFFEGPGATPPQSSPDMDAEDWVTGESSGEGRVDAADADADADTAVKMGEGLPRLFLGFSISWRKAGSTVQREPFPVSSSVRGSFTNDLLRERLCLTEFYVEEKKRSGQHGNRWEMGEETDLPAWVSDAV